MEQSAIGGAASAWTSGDAVQGWQKGVQAREAAVAPATDLMMTLAGVTAGQRVLDIGAGTGEQSVEAARRVGPNGSVLATDLSPVMLDQARAGITASGLSNIETAVMDAQSLDLSADSFDAAIARFSLQFVPDVGRGLSEIRRVLKPGGRFAAVVFSSVEANPFRAGPQAIASRLGGTPFPPPGPGQFALNDPTVIGDAFRAAGFRDVEVHPVPVLYRFPTLDDAIQNLAEAQPLLTKLLDALDEQGRAAAWSEIRALLAPFEGPDGFAGPSEALVAAGTA